MQITLLGTSAMVPTKTRNHSAIFISYENEGILFDCGEGTQRQLKLAGLKLTKVTRIFISHWHGDHVLGIPGLLQSLENEDYQKTLQIYGPKGTKYKIESLISLFASDKSISIKINEIDNEIISETSDFFVSTKKLEHKSLCYGYAFIEKDKRKMKMQKIKELGIPEGPLLGKLQKGNSIIHNEKTIKADDVTSIVKGKKITYIADTKICENAIKLANNSTVLICESTYDDSNKEKAEEYTHLTSSDAASIAHESNSKKLILTHISQRYKDTTELLNQARTIFPNTELGFDLMKIKF